MSHTDTYAMRYISRMDYDKHCPGWWVRFTKKSVIIKHEKFRDDDFEQGKEESLLNAITWRDENEKELIATGAIPPIYGCKFDPVHDRLRKDNKSGTPGVARVECMTKKNGVPFLIMEWRATWVEYFKIDGKIIRKCRYCLKI